MSVIGTTLKQPRVFAHDAVALQNLPGCTWRGVKGLELVDGGSGFVAGDYATWLSTPITTSNAGNGLNVTVVSVDGTGVIIDEEIEIPDCGYGNAYNVGDFVSINSPTIGGSDAVYRVKDLIWTAWDYGCPFTSAYMGSQQVLIEDITDANVGNPLYGSSSYDGSGINLGDENVNGELGQIDQLTGFLKKTMYKYTCGCEEGTCSCTYETPGPGAALYIGAAMTSITLVMESGSVTTFNNVPAGSFMPVSALTVCAAVPVDEIEPKDVILALF
jgi:hypothetical protein